MEHTKTEKIVIIVMTTLLVMSCFIAALDILCS